MDEQHIRALVREAIARHHGGDVTTAAPQRPSAPAPGPDAAGPFAISHRQFQIVRPAGEVECLIEPAVACNHCGHCQCYGH